MSNEHYMDMASSNLSYANDELSSVLNYLETFIKINSRVFGYEYTEYLQGCINNQIKNIDYCIIPAIEEEE